MDYNFHTHTARCRHASEMEREYIESAIAGGIKRMGFSEHMPFRLPDGSESTWRVPVAEGEDYVKTLRALREEYRDRIELHIGFEMEYYPNCFKDMLRNAKALGAEYLILGQHFTNETEDAKLHTSRLTEDEKMMREYADTLIAAMESGVFTYVAHPDVCRFVGSDEVYRRENVRIMEASLRTDTPLEINFYGIRDHRHYPNEKFWEIAGEYRVPVTFGCDAHTAADAADLASLPHAMELVKKYKLNYIGAPKLRPLA